VSLDEKLMTEVHETAQRSGLSDDEVIEQALRRFVAWKCSTSSGPATTSRRLKPWRSPPPSCGRCVPNTRHLEPGAVP